MKGNDTYVYIYIYLFIYLFTYIHAGCSYLLWFAGGCRKSQLWIWHHPTRLAAAGSHLKWWMAHRLRWRWYSPLVSIEVRGGYESDFDGIQMYPVCLSAALWALDSWSLANARALAADEARFTSQFVAVCDDSEIILADHTAECYWYTFGTNINSHESWLQKHELLPMIRHRAGWPQGELNLISP